MLPNANVHKHAHGHNWLLLPQAVLLNLLLLCVPAHPACPLLPGFLMRSARQPFPITCPSSFAVKAACAVAGWCAEGWLLEDPRHLREAAYALTASLRKYCEQRTSGRACTFLHENPCSVSFEVPADNGVYCRHASLFFKPHKLCSHYKSVRLTQYHWACRQQVFNGACR
jgi:hypothetical protein